MAEREAISFREVSILEPSSGGAAVKVVVTGAAAAAMKIRLSQIEILAPGFNGRKKNNSSILPCPILLTLSELVFLELPTDPPLVLVSSMRFFLPVVVKVMLLKFLALSGRGMVTFTGLWNFRLLGSRVTMGETAPPWTRISSTRSSLTRWTEMLMSVGLVRALKSGLEVNYFSLSLSYFMEYGKVINKRL